MSLREVKVEVPTIRVRVGVLRIPANTVIRTFIYRFFVTWFTVSHPLVWMSTCPVPDMYSMDGDTMVVASVTNIGCFGDVDDFTMLAASPSQTRAVRQHAHQPNIGDQPILLAGSQDQAERVFPGHTSQFVTMQRQQDHRSE